MCSEKLQGKLLPLLFILSKFTVIHSFSICILPISVLLNMEIESFGTFLYLMEKMNCFFFSLVWKCILTILPNSTIFLWHENSQQTNVLLILYDDYRMSMIVNELFWVKKGIHLLSKSYVKSWIATIGTFSMKVQIYDCNLFLYSQSLH